MRQVEEECSQVAQDSEHSKVREEPYSCIRLKKKSTLEDKPLHRNG